MKRLLTGVLLALAASVASAAPCFPAGGGASIDVQGKALMEGYSPVNKGTWRAIWCPTGTFSPTTGTEVWQLYVHATLDKYKTVTVDTLWTMGLQVMQSSDSRAALAAALKAGEYIPPAGSQDRFDWESLLYAGCKEGERLAPFPGQPFTKNCIPPTPLPGATEVWKTPPSGTFTTFTSSGGKLAGIVVGVKALPNADCFCTLSSVMSGTSRYCPTDQTKPAQVTYCVKK